jgi:hypothetical protein
VRHRVSTRALKRGCPVLVGRGSGGVAPAARAPAASAPAPRQYRRPVGSAGDARPVPIQRRARVGTSPGSALRALRLQPAPPAVLSRAPQELVGGRERLAAESFDHHSDAPRAGCVQHAHAVCLTRARGVSDTHARARRQAAGGRCARGGRRRSRCQDAACRGAARAAAPPMPTAARSVSRLGGGGAAQRASTLAGQWRGTAGRARERHARRGLGCTRTICGARWRGEVLPRLWNASGAIASGAIDCASSAPRR